MERRLLASAQKQKENKNIIQIMNDNNAKETYQKPVSEIVDLELEQPILSGSAQNYKNGGRWGF